MSERAPLPIPVARVLADDVAPETLERLFREHERRAASTRARGARRVAVAAAAAALIGVGSFWLGRVSAPAASSGEATPARVAGPTASSVFETEGARRSVSFGDGAWVALAPRTRITVRENGADDVRLALERGRLQVGVPEGRTRRWTVETSVARVVVVGTRFSVATAGERATVRVHHGTVRVLSAWLPDGAVVLERGESVTVERAREVVAVDETRVEQDRASRPLPRVRNGTPRDRDGPSERAPEPEDLFETADALRRAGRAREAIAPLERIVATQPGTQEAAIASLTIGRICDDAIGDDACAIDALERARAIGLPSALATEVDRRLARLGAITDEP